jgi:starch-binding outer membrane protein, SusD/RagB family
MKKLIYPIFTLFVAVSLSSCSDFFNPDTSEILLEKNYVGDYTELYSGYMGLAATVKDVADQAMFLEGLRGDFMEPTPNAPREIWDVYNHQDLSGNSFASPKGYYNVIMNANDYLAHVFAYRKKDSTSVSQTDFKGMVGGAIRYKVWAYLQLAKIYGEAVYIDEPVTSYGEISKYPVLKFDDLISKCINLIETGVNGIDGKGDVNWITVLFPGQSLGDANWHWNKITPPDECLLAELYLYQNNFQKVKENCIAFIKRGGEQENYSYQINLSEYNGEWQKMFYTRTSMRKENAFLLFYDYSLHQTNRIVKYFSNTYPNSYYLRPTSVGMKRFKAQTVSGIPNDTYRGNGVTFKDINGDTVIYKFLQGNLTADKIYTNDASICLYRAAEIHMFLVEALVGLGQFQQALTFLNKGISGAGVKIVNNQLQAPFQEYPTTLYLPSGDKSNSGIRGRVNLDAVGTFALNSASALDTLVNMRRLDSLIVEEASLELAGEGKAYFVMNRMARRWSDNADRSWASHWTNAVGNNNPNNLWGADVQNVWATKIGAKYSNGTGATVSSTLKSNLDNWFIKYNLSE